MMLSRFVLALATCLMASSVDATGLRERRERVNDLHELRDLMDDQGIAGGAQVTDNTFPFMVLFAFSNSPFTCGGALIASDRVLTSAKCIQDLYGSTGAAGQSAQIGAWDTANVGEDRTIECVFNHPSFSDAGTIPVNDLAVVKLTSASTKTTLDGSANPNVTNGNEPIGTWTLIGFGSESSGSTLPITFLKNVSLPYVDLTTCNGFYGGLLQEGVHFCAGGASGDGGCNGDTGGVLMAINAPLTINQLWTAIGVYSYSSPNCGQGTPDVFTDIAFYVDSFIFPSLSTTCPTTPAPTPNPTPAPTPGPAGPGPTPTTPSTPSPTIAPTACPCFSEESTVEVRDDPHAPPKLVAMKDLEVGQQVFAGYKESGYFGKKVKTPVYETVYGFGHRNTLRHESYLRITTKGSETQPLEISRSHLIYVQGKSEPVRADTLQVGEHLLHKSLDHGDTKPVKITKIESIVRKGLYQPLTKDGTIVVNGMEASAYVSMEELSPRVVEFGRKVYSEHRGFHLWTAPYRFVCTKVAPQLCVDDYNFEEDGISHWMAFGKTLLMICEDLPMWAMAIYLAIVGSLCGAIMMLDNLLEGNVKVWTAVGSIIGVYWLCCKRGRPGKAKVE